jgi:hypothetical protein
MTLGIPPQSAFATNAVTKVSTEDDVYTADFTRLLKAGQLLNASPTPIVEILSGQTDLAIANVAVNAAPVLDDYGNMIAIGMAVQWEMTGGDPSAAAGRSGVLYQLRITATRTDGKKKAGLCEVYLQG